MNVQLKQRLVGVTVLGFVAIIILPILFGHRPDNENVKVKNKQVEEFVIATPQVDKKIDEQLPVDKPKEEELFSAKETDKTNQYVEKQIIPSDEEAMEEEIPSPPEQTLKQPVAVNSPKEIKNLDKIENRILNTSPVKPAKKLVVAKQPLKIPPPHLTKKTEPLLANHSGAWVVQLGSFANKTNAEKLIKDLRSKGFTAFVKSGENTEGAHYSRVFVGPEIERSKAEEVVHNIQKLLSLHGVVVRYKG